MRRALTSMRYKCYGTQTRLPVRVLGLESGRVPPAEDLEHGDVKDVCAAFLRGSSTAHGRSNCRRCPLDDPPGDRFVSDPALKCSREELQENREAGGQETGQDDRRVLMGRIQRELAGEVDNHLGG